MDKSLSYNQRYYRENRERELARVKTYTKANPEKVRARNKRRYETPKGKAKAIADAMRWAKENPKRYAEIRQRASLTYRLKQHGLTVEDYEAMLSAQNGCCAACKSPDPGLGRNGKQGAKQRLKKGWPSVRLHPTIIIWNIDHDHITGKVRGLLCRSCNIALGAVRDNPDRLRALIDYLSP